MKKTMTILECLQEANINAEEELNQWNVATDWIGTTPKGERFHMYRSNGYGLKFVLYAKGKTLATNAKLATAIRLIKRN